MTTSVYPAQGGTTDNTTAANFIPELWSDEIIAAYKKNLIIANLVTKMPMTGKKGDTLYIPTPTRGAATAKAANTAVTIQNETAGKITVTIDKHFEYSRMIEDITDVQALASMRKFYTDDAGYALSKKVEDDLFLLGQSTQGGNGSNWAKAVEITTATGALTDYTGTAQAFTDAGFRNLIQLLDDADVPMDGRSVILPPSARNTIMGIDRYTSSDFVGGNTVVNGKIGNLYGVDVYISNNCPVDGANKIGMLLHKDAFVYAEQMSVRSQTQYKQEWLADLFTSDCIYGAATLRGTSAVAVALPA
jgi:HK97 family phage major capsid protein